MAETMIERVANAIASVPYKYGEQTILMQARAVLTAMREPTEAMKSAGMAACGGDGSVLDGWEAMIDDALAEEGQ